MTTTTDQPLVTQSDAVLLVITKHLTTYWFLPEKSQQEILAAMEEYKKQVTN